MILRKNTFIFPLIIILVFTTMLGYMPSVYADISLYSTFRLLNIGILVLLFMFTKNFKKLLGNNFFNKLLICILIMTMILYVASALGFKASLNGVMPIIMAYVAIWIGYELNLSHSKLLFILFLSSIVAIYLGYSAISFYLRDFSLETNMYLMDGKNQIGMLVGATSFFIFYLSQMVKGKLRIFSYIIFAILFILLVFIRCRTVLVATLLALAIFIYKISSRNKLLLLGFAFLIILLIFLEQFIEIFNSVFILDRSVSNLNELSTGRFERNIQAMEFIGLHLFDGEFKLSSNIPLIHNFILRNLVSYGIWATPIIIYYLIIAFKFAMPIYRKKIISIYDIGYFVLIIPFFTSLLEPDAPFGPGSVMLIFYLLFGISLRNSKELKVD